MIFPRAMWYLQGVGHLLSTQASAPVSRRYSIMAESAVKLERGQNWLDLSGRLVV